MSKEQALCECGHDREHHFLHNGLSICSVPAPKVGPYSGGLSCKCLNFTSRPAPDAGNDTDEIVGDVQPINVKRKVLRSETMQITPDAITPVRGNDTDLIEAAREFLGVDKSMDYEPYHQDCGINVFEMMAAFAQHILAQQVADARSQWVAVSDRLPETEDWYWVTTTKSGEPTVTQAHFLNGELLERCVVAWMPIDEPSPYQQPNDAQGGEKE